MAITAADVKKLREKTGAGMLDCKKALTEANGEFAKAERLLKELGLAAAAKRSGRATEQGRVFTKISGNKAVLLELACETDFVARNTDFIKLGEDIASVILDKSLTEITPELNDMVKNVISTIKENMSVRRFKNITIADNELAVEYIHGAGNIGVIVKLESDKQDALNDAKVKEFVFDCALHIAAFNPLYINKDAVDPAYLKEQEEIFKTQALKLGKPEKVLDGIVKGKMGKHLTEICFLNQGFVKDDKQSVSKVMESIGNEVGAKLNIKEYFYYKSGAEA